MLFDIYFVPFVLHLESLSSHRMLVFVLFNTYPSSRDVIRGLTSSNTASWESSGPWTLEETTLPQWLLNIISLKKHLTVMCTVQNVDVFKRKLKSYLFTLRLLILFTSILIYFLEYYLIFIILDLSYDGWGYCLYLFYSLKHFETLFVWKLP